MFMYFVSLCVHHTSHVNVQIATIIRKVKSAHLMSPSWLGLLSQNISYMICHRICNVNNMTGVTSEAGTIYPPGTWVHLSGVRVSQSLIVCIVSCGPLLDSFDHYNIWSSVCRRLMVSDYPLVFSNFPASSALLAYVYLCFHWS